MILFDTDILTLYLRGHEKVRQHIERLDGEETIAISIITRIQVLQGRFDFLLKAANQNELQQAMALLQRSEADLDAFEVVSIDMAAAQEFERLRVQRKLKRIGRADLLIACIAMAQDATLVTRNVNDFEPLKPRLRFENWAD